MKYFQTWNKVTRVKKLPFVGECAYKFLQWLCEKTTGHEASRTEWGYGGGDFADCWCRWCNQHIQVQKTVIMFKHKDVNAKSQMDLVGTDINS